MAHGFHEVRGPGIKGHLGCEDGDTAQFVVAALEQSSANEDRLDRLEATVVQLDRFIRTLVTDVSRATANHGMGNAHGVQHDGPSVSSSSSSH